MLSVVNPKSKVAACRALRTSSAAPARRTTLTTTCTVKSTLRSRRRVPPTGPSRFSTVATDRRTTYSDGARPNVTQVTITSAAVQTSTRPSGAAENAGAPSAPNWRVDPVQEIPRNDKRHAPADQRCGARDDEAFGQQLAKESRTSRAERHPDRQLMAPRGASSQEEIADIRTRQHEHEERAEPQQSEHRVSATCFPGVRIEAGSRENDAPLWRRAVRVQIGTFDLGPVPAMERIELGRGLLPRHVRTESRGQSSLQERLRVGLREVPRSQRNPHVLARERRAAEISWSDAQHGERRRVEVNGCPDDGPTPTRNAAATAHS